MFGKLKNPVRISTKRNNSFLCSGMYEFVYYVVSFALAECMYVCMNALYGSCMCMYAYNIGMGRWVYVYTGERVYTCICIYTGRYT